MRILYLLLAAVLALTTLVPAAAKENDCHNYWHFSHTLEIDSGFWSAGDHYYEFMIAYSDGSTTYTYLDMPVNPDADLYKGQVYLRYWALLYQDMMLPAVHPDQDTVFQISWPTFESSAEAKAFAQTVEVYVSWDGGEWIIVPQGPVTSNCAFNNPGHNMRSWGPVY
jgi:hypothetical protein